MIKPYSHVLKAFKGFQPLIHLLANLKKKKKVGACYSSSTENNSRQAMF